MQEIGQVEDSSDIRVASRNKAFGSGAWWICNPKKRHGTTNQPVMGIPFKQRVDGIRDVISGLNSVHLLVY